MEDSLTRVRLHANGFSWFLCFSPAKSEAPVQLSLSISLSATLDFNDMDKLTRHYNTWSYRNIIRCVRLVL